MSETESESKKSAAPSEEMEFVIIRDVSSPGSWGDGDPGKGSSLDLRDDSLSVSNSVLFLYLVFLVAGISQSSQCNVYF